MVAGYAIGGGHVLHVVCDLTIAADNARFGQTGPQRRLVRRRLRLRAAGAHRSARRRRARSGSCAEQYDAQAALDMGLVNTVVPLDDLEVETVAWCREMLEHSPLALRMLKASMQRGRRRPRRHPAARRRRDAPLLHERGGAGGQARLPREAPARLRPVPEAAVTPCAGADRAADRRLTSVVGGRARGRGRWARRSRRCSSAPRPRSPTDRCIWWRALAALVVALALQVGVNYANDYSDGVRGTDTDRRARCGSPRPALASPAAVRNAARRSRSASPRSSGCVLVARREPVAAARRRRRDRGRGRSTPAARSRTATSASAR